jgi:hypothetical protein
MSGQCVAILIRPFDSSASSIAVVGQRRRRRYCDLCVVVSAAQRPDQPEWRPRPQRAKRQWQCQLDWDCNNRQTRRRSTLARRGPYHSLIDTTDCFAWKDQSWNKIPPSKSHTRQLVPWGSSLGPLRWFPSKRHSCRYIWVVAVASFELVPTSHFDDAGAEVVDFVDSSVRRAVDMKHTWSNGRWY